MLVLVMLNLGLSFGGRRIAGAAIVVPLAFFIAYESLRNMDIQKYRLLIIYFALSIFFVFTTAIHIDESIFVRLESTLLIIASTSSIIVIYYILSNVNPLFIRKYIFYLMLFVLIFANLEVNIQFFKYISDLFRHFIYDGAFIYSSDTRDLLIAGKIRPNVFTQEPSHIAKLLAFSICTYGLLIQRTAKKFLVVISLFIISIVTISSPTIFLGAILYAYLFFFLYGQHQRNRIIVAYVVLIAIILSYFNLSWVTSFLPGERMNLIAQGLDNSMLTRSEGPKQVLFNILQEKPFFGIGIGAREAVQDVVVSVYSNFDMFYVQNIIENPGYNGWGNAFFESFIYFGLINGFAFFCILGYLMNRLGLPMHGFAAIFFIIFISDSGFAAPRVWFYFSLVCAASIIFIHTNRRRASNA